MEQNIVIERHYLTPQMYREMYLGYPHYFINRYHQSNYPIINQNQHSNLAPSYNQNIPIFPQTPQIYQNNVNTNPIYQPTTHSANQPFSQPVNRPNHRENNIVNLNTNATTNATTNANPTIVNNAINNPINNAINIPSGGSIQAPAEIRNLINNLINNNTPFQLEVSTLPITRILNQFRAEINGRDDNNSGISLANINNISSVNVFSALSSNNTSEEMCSICQNEFEGSDIVRRLNNCNHIFHLNCVDTWLSNHNTCPTCRNDLTNDNTEQTSDDEENYSDPESATEEENNEEDDDEEYECHDECDSNCGCDCHDEEEDYTDCDDDESIAAAPISTTSNNSITPQDNEERNGIINYFVINNSRNASNTISNTGNTSNIYIPNSIPSPQSTTTSTSTTSSTTTNINNASTNTTRHSLNNSNIHIFTSNSINAAGAVLGEFQNDINHIINLGTPFINTILGTNNTASQLNATHINGNVNNMISAINPLLAALNNIINQ